MHSGTSFPVGKVDFLDLYPLCYREFLAATGEKQLSELLVSDDPAPAAAPTLKPHVHTWSGWTVTAQPAALEEGTETRTCTCGEEEGRDSQKRRDHSRKEGRHSCDHRQVI